MIEKVPTKSIGTGQFVIGDSKVRPRIDDAFKRDEKMGIYFKLYNFQPDEKTHKPDRAGHIRSGPKRQQRKDLSDFTEDSADRFRTRRQARSRLKSSCR